MTTITLDDFTRDQALQPQPKWVMENNEWVLRDHARARSGDGWIEIAVPIDNARKGKPE